MKRICLITLLTISSLLAFSQNQTNHWYYKGGEGLDFTNGTPTLLTNGSIGAAEGTAAISDSLGNLLFYTDGVTIWNSTHSAMPNGTGLMGNISTAQSAMIIPQPNNSNIYYVFTADQTCGSNGLRYSIVNMSLNNGLGDVVLASKNTLLVSPVFEKMAAVHHCNGEDIWFLSMKTNGDFYTWLVTEDGLCNCPVISTTGPVHTQGFGNIKFSNNGKNLVVTDHGGTCNINISNVHTDVYDFDNNMGEVNFYQTIDTANTSSSSSGGSFWGASFSPNNEVLYLSTGYYPYNGSAGSSIAMAVVQYDLNDPDIESSAVLLFDNYYNSSGTAPGCGSPMGSLQLGSDGRIYVGNSCTNGLGMDVITSPNTLGTGCTYVHGGVFGANGSGYGITNFIESYFGDGIDTCNVGGIKDMCEFLTQPGYGIDTRTECRPYIWMDGNTYTEDNDTAVFTIVNGAANNCDSIVTLDLTIDTVDVSVISNGPSITAITTGALYQWIDCDNNNSIISGATSQTFTATSLGSYSVQITINGCTDTSDCILITTLGMAENPLFNHVSIYPNPTKGVVNIDLGQLKNVSINVFDLTGQVIYTDENISGPKYQFEINAKNGIYFIELKSSNYGKRYKLIIG